MNDALEILGGLLVVAFCVVVWWPAAMLVGGLLLVLVANLRADAPAVPARVSEPAA